MRRRLVRLAVLAGLLSAGLAMPAAAAPDGGAIYGRCAACHTRTGAGVPGAFPPLASDFRNLAAKPEGRRYLALVVTRGVSGPITVDGKPYRGIMPAQVLDDAEVAAVLNHVGTVIAKAGPVFTPFTEGEVAGFRASGAGLSGADVGRLHAGAGGR